MKKQLGFIQIPVIVIILLITGGFITAYSVSHRSTLPSQNTNLSQKEATPSATMTAPSPSGILKNPNIINSQSENFRMYVPTSTPLPAPNIVSNTPSLNNPSNQTSNSTSTPSPVSSSTTIGLTAPSNSQTPNAKGQVSITLKEVDLYYTTGRIAVFGQISGNVSGLKPNTDYSVDFSSPSRGGGIVVASFHTDASGNASFNASGGGISYTPVNPTWTVDVYFGGNVANLSLQGNFSINSANTISQ